MFESIKVLERRFDIFPAKFFWRGQVHRVDAVNECKTVTNYQQSQYHFWVRCDGQMYHLCEVLPAGQWLLYSDE